MARLTARDYRDALDLLKLAGDAGGSDPFPEQVLERLRMLIPCDCVSYGDYAGPDARRLRIRAVPRGRLPVPAAVRRAHDRLRRESPLRPRRSTVGRAVRRSDLVPRAAFRRTALYQDVDRVLGIEDTMSLWLVDRGRLVGGFAFDSVTRDFTSRDVLVLDTLAPHLARLHRATRIRAVHETAVVEELTPREREVLGVVAEGLTTREIAATLCIAPGTVRKHLDNIFAKLGVGTRAAAVRVLVGARFTVD